MSSRSPSTGKSDDRKVADNAAVGGVWDALSPILTALVTGVGLLAFVALFGGAILWDRAEEAGLPGTEAVALMPRSVLLSTGGHFLVWAIVLSVAAVAALYLIDLGLLAWATRVAEKKAKDAQQRIKAGAAGPSLDAWDEGVPGGGTEKAAHAVATAMERLEEVEGQIKAADAQVATAMERGEQDVSAQLASRTSAYENRRKLRDELRKARADLTREVAERSERRWRYVRFALLALLLVGLELTLVYFREWLELWQIAVLVAVSLGTTALAVGVYHATRKFSWFAVVAFLGVSAFQGVATHYEITTVPRVEPAAVLIGGVEPIAGVFVAETDDRIYLGVSSTGVVGESASLVALPRGKVQGLAVGQLAKVRPDDDSETDATERADELAETLCSHAPLPITQKQRTAAPKCIKLPSG